MLVSFVCVIIFVCRKKIDVCMFFNLKLKKRTIVTFKMIIVLLMTYKSTQAFQ